MSALHGTINKIMFNSFGAAILLQTVQSTMKIYKIILVSFRRAIATMYTKSEVKKYQPTLKELSLLTMLTEPL